MRGSRIASTTGSGAARARGCRRRLVVLAVAGLALAWPASAQVYSLGSGGRMVVDNTDEGDTFTCYDRPKHATPFRWGGAEYLFLDASTDVMIFDLDQPGRAVAAAGLGLGLNCLSSLGIGAELGSREGTFARGHGAGTRSSDTATAQTSTSLLGVDGILETGVCDDCRYGYIYTGSRGILFDLGVPGTTTRPAFADAWAYDRAQIGLTYRDGGSQYLVARGLQPICGTDPQSPQWGVYRLVDSGGSPTFELVQCMDGSFEPPLWGVELTASGGPNVVVYQVDRSKRVEVATINADHVPEVRSSIAALSFSVDGHAYPLGPAHVLIANPDSVPSTGLYIITAAGPALSVTRSGVVIPEPKGSPTGWEIPIVTVSGRGGYALLLTEGDGSSAARGLFRLSGLGTPAASAVEVDHAYWNNPQSDFNMAALDPSPGKISERGGAFAPDGSGVYLTRYYQMCYLAYTGQAQEPSAALSVSPSAPFPGDQVAILNDSINWTTARLWVTRGALPNDPVVVGADTGWGAGNLSLTWNSPEALDCTTPYYAHVQIDDTGPIATAAINFNCTPMATLDVDNPSPLVGETVTLTGDGEGHAPAQDSAYRWSVLFPDGSSTTITGRVVQLTLTQMGTWQIGLDVTYSHWNSTDLGGTPIPYNAHATKTLFVTSTSAAIAVTPAHPGPTDQITLSASGTRLAQGHTAHYAFTVDEAPAGAGCAGDVTGGANGVVSIPDCVFPASSMAFDVPHTATLEVHDAISMSLSEASVTFTVQSTSLDFTWSPSNPEKGEPVTFTISGDGSAPISWSFGGANCEGDASEVSCGIFGCSGLQWSYRDAGSHTVTLHLNDGSVILHTLTVQNSGSCTSSCTYSLSGNHAFSAAGGTGSITVTTSSGCAWSAQSNSSWISTVSPSSGSGNSVVTFAVAANTGASTRYGSLAVAGNAFQVSQEGLGGGVDFTWVPTNPEKGEAVTFSISGDAGRAVSWNLGGVNCGGETGTQSCAAFGCSPFQWRYRDAGVHTVTLALDDGSTISHSIAVQDTGSCGSTCSYALSSSSASVGAAGTGSGEFSVSAASSCSWSAQSNQSWLRVTSPVGSATGAGTVRYTVDANPVTTARTAFITVAGVKKFTVTQAAASTPTQPSSLVIPAAAHVPGQRGTLWKTDVRVFNPGGGRLHVAIDFLAEGQDNSGAIPGVAFDLAPRATMVIDDVLEVIPGVGDSPSKGSLRFRFDEDDGVPIVTSRTYNQTSTGSYGQYVPAVPVGLGQNSILTLTGLSQNELYRSNLGLANLTDTTVAGVIIHLLDESGAEVGSLLQSVPPLSSVQLVNLARMAGAEGDLDLYSVRIDTGGQAVAAYASVVDNLTGDPVYFTPGGTMNGLVYLPGVAHLGGANGSVWRTDVSLFNPGTSSIEAYLEYVPDQPGELEYHITAPLEPGEAYDFKDILGWLLGDDASSKGYFVLSGVDGSPAPQVVARTYNQTTSGTYGQSIVPFAGSGLAGVDEPTYIPGVSSSADHGAGFRTNLGLLNAGVGVAVLDIVVYDTDGSVIGEIPSLPLAEGTFYQFPLFAQLGQLASTTLDATVQITVRSGGPVGAYASVIDNRTGDPVMIPALRE